MAEAPLAVEAIVANGLCIGCGLCQGIAGPERIRIAMTPEGRERPHVLSPLDQGTVARINAVCPGVAVAGPDAGTVPDSFALDTIWGPAGRIVKGHATDPDVRFRAAAGGALSALAIFLLDSRRVDGVLHVRAARDRPMRSEPHVSRTAAEVMHGAGSRYGPAAPLTRVTEHLDGDQRFAFVGKPCDVSALRALARIDPRVDRRVPYMLALVCGGASELGKSRRVLDRFGVTEDELAVFRYRGYGNPGPTRIETRDGRAFELTYNDMWADEETWQLQFRCKICADPIGEGADVAVLDVWPGGGPTGEDAGFNGIVARTARGLELVDAAIAAGAIAVDGAMTFRDLDVVQPHQVRKKQAIVDRLAALREAGAPAPR
ncbi:MAG: Coenzyme F420 hydrogenase/dehydrogenase, beta subunit C-terminal domain, partial [Alphaproteobacteria bacterium]